MNEDSDISSTDSHYHAKSRLFSQPSTPYSQLRHYSLSSSLYQRWFHSSVRFKQLFLPVRVHAATVVTKEQAGDEKRSADSNDVNDALEETTSIDRMVGLKRHEISLIVTDAEVEEYIRNEKPLDRIKKMFSKDKQGRVSPELEVTTELITKVSAIVFMGTSLVGSWAARDAFVAKHKHVKFETKFIAARKYNDAMLFGGLRMGMKWGLKSAAFTTLFLFTSQGIAVYNNKTSVYEYMIAGGITCSILRLNLGLKGFMSGYILGSAVGLLGGVLYYIMLRSMNETQEARHRRHVYRILMEEKEVEKLQSRGSSCEESVTELSAVDHATAATT